MVENCIIYIGICFGDGNYHRQESMLIQELLHACIKGTMNMDHSHILKKLQGAEKRLYKYRRKNCRIERI
jgi:hypothetical protein